MGTYTVILKGNWGITQFKFPVCKKCKLRYNCFYMGLLTLDKKNLIRLDRIEAQFTVDNPNFLAGIHNNKKMKNDDTKYFSKYSCDVSPKMAIKEVLKIRKDKNDG